MQHAFRDFESNQMLPIRIVCETLRNVAVVIFNTAYGRQKKDAISDPKKLWKFGWEKDDVKIQTVDEMKQTLKGLAFVFGNKSKKNKKDAG